MTGRDGDAQLVRQAVDALFPGGRLKVRAAPSCPAGADWLVAVDTGSLALELLVELRHSLTGAQLRDAITQLRHSAETSGRLSLLAADYLSPAMQERLREAEVPFIDFAGNAWLVQGAIHVDRRGFANPSASVRLPRGPFSDKASLVVRSLFASSEGRGVRELAGELGLTAGYVSKVLSELDRRGYLARPGDGVHLRHAEELLRDWLHAYRGRSPSWTRTFFTAASSAKALLETVRQSPLALSPDYALTMQSGASLVSRHAEFDTVEIYVRESATAEAVAATLRARPVSRGANLVVMVPYYRVSAFYGERRVRGLSVVSDLQLYLDLYDFPQRGREQAERIYERKLLPRVRRLDGAS
jgi:hypothetical protein